MLGQTRPNQGPNFINSGALRKELFVSIAAINDFFAKLDENPDLAQELDQVDLQDKEKYKLRVVALARKYNYDFTIEELNKVIAAAKTMQQEGTAPAAK